METKKPFAAIICSEPANEESGSKPALNYSVNSQMNDDWEERAGITPTYRKDTDDHDA